MKTVLDALATIASADLIGWFVMLALLFLSVFFAG